MRSKISAASGPATASEFLTTSRAAPSHPLSTLDTKGWTVVPLVGQMSTGSPVASSYQL